MKIEGKEYRTIWFDEKNQTVKIIDQTKLPHQFIIKDLKTVKDAINAIKTMEVRGAPLIGGTAAYGIVLAVIENNNLKLKAQLFSDSGFESFEYELIGRGTEAINIGKAVGEQLLSLAGTKFKKK